MKENNSLKNITIRILAIIALLAIASAMLLGCGKSNKDEFVNDASEELSEVTSGDNQNEKTYPVFNDLEDPVGATRKGIRGPGTIWHPNWIEQQKICKDIIGWIKCDNTVMDYPIAQGTDNDYYLNTTNYGVTDGVGIPFVDFREEKPFEGFLTVLYGHRMKNGTMFKHISYYFYDNGEDFYDEYPIYKIYTPEHDYDLKIVGWARVSETDGNTYDFELCNGNESVEDKQEYLNYLASINQLKHPKYSVDVDDRLVLMSTCTAQLDEDREVVWGKLIPVR